MDIYETLQLQNRIELERLKIAFNRQVRGVCFFNIVVQENYPFYKVYDSSGGWVYQLIVVHRGTIYPKNFSHFTLEKGSVTALVAPTDKWEESFGPILAWAHSLTSGR